jgi:phosphoribosylformylglycinamidine synthase I
MPEAPADRPVALVLRTEGTNCDAEMARAFELAGAHVRVVHVGRVLADPGVLGRGDVIGFPGGFSHGDDVASGRVLATRLRERAWGELCAAADRGVPMIGVCNGFQVMVQIGLLPGPRRGQAWEVSAPPAPEVGLAANASARFVDRWVGVRVEPNTACVWSGAVDSSAGDEVMRLPVAHGEGRFVAPAPVLDRLAEAGQVVLRYTEDVNGSDGAVAGICDAGGRIFGLMPHPERYLEWNRHPWWTRLSEQTRSTETPGLAIFRGAVRSAAREAAC